ncbi:antibiotic biosynthesis monooxygenase [Rhizobium sp. L1K21]|uniref:antibiotic biosynthesis monooxygenase family protein n=1 Tax=Rhizobium sp. L1K21 TaxID=2954933 RepID=UPI0020924DB8|nr:antibiotic biosynthesis monooxygenase [Rhizobium sp. L1K21]MCO6185852.1 antibiotic biosynthesis monooxygenase [Rhizobium sp. L1K21]
MSSPAKLPPPPYYVVIFSTLRTDVDDGYAGMAEKMEMLAEQQPGYLGIESAREPGGLGITNSYWKDEASIIAWKKNAEHTLAREMGRERWYKCYELRVAKVERAYAFEK